MPNDVKNIVNQPKFHRIFNLNYVVFWRRGDRSAQKASLSRFRSQI